MSAASVSPHGFTVVRRGYRPDAADARVGDLSRERDAAWERASRLTVLAQELETEAERLREAVATLEQPTYETLSARARQVLSLSEEEAAEVRSTALADAQGAREGAQNAGWRLGEETREAAEATRAAADARAEETLLAANTEAGELLAAAGAEAQGTRSKALDDWQETRQRAEALLAELEAQQAERWESEGRELAARAADHDARLTELIDRAEAVLDQAKRGLAETEESARHGQEDAEAQAAEILAQAGLEEERTVRETERVLREHEESRDEIHGHMAHIRNSLAALTGRPAAED